MERVENLSIKTSVIEIQVEGAVLPISEMVYGNGPYQILALHGWNEQGKDNLQKMINNLSPQKYTVYVPDLPGFGKSADPNKPWGVEDYSKFTESYLQAHGIKDSVDVIGHSFGSRIGIMLASSAPDMVKRMVLLNAAGVSAGGPAKADIKLKIYKSVRRQLEKMGLRSAANSLRNVYTSLFGSDNYKNANPTMKNTLVKVVNTDLHQAASNIKCPTLLLWGENDNVTPVEDANELKKVISSGGGDCDLVILKGVGHYVHNDRPKETAKIVSSMFS